MENNVLEAWQRYIIENIERYQKVEDLGYLYEEFVAQNPLFRSQMGVYYTPVEIVRYIVAETIGKKIAGKTPSDILNMTCLDPSCGSGSFLLGAYDFLLKWYLEYYVSLLNLGKKVPELTPNNELTTQVKKDILLRHIFGVDIDEQAVEVTKLSLLIKCLEGETKGSVETQTAVFKQKVLPSLEENILCGNSLIGSNFYEGKLFPTPREMRKINVFDWHIGFKNQLKKGGFEVIIGNPPYGSTFNEEQKNYLKKHYPTSDIEIESYLIFIEKAFYLLNNTGFCSFIVPSNLLTNMRYDKTRLFLLKQTNIEKILDLGGNVFKQASVDTCILVFNKHKTENHIIQTYIGDFVKKENIEKKEAEREIIISNYKLFSQNYFEKNLGALFNIYSPEKNDSILIKIAQDKELLTNLVKFARWVEFGYNSKYITKNKKLKKAKPIIAGRCIQKYVLSFENKYVLFDEKDVKNFKERIIYESEKILLRRIGHDIIAVFDSEKYYNVCDVYNILAKNGTNLKYILAILNSKLMSFYLKTKFSNSKKLFPKIPIAYLEQLPIKVLDLKKEAEKKQFDTLLLLVENIETTQKNLNNSIVEHEKKLYERLFTSLLSQIDEIIYQIYNLTPEEIEIIENGQ
jgi:type I restriction-modification system DNA methylase subunit